VSRIPSLFHSNPIGQPSGRSLTKLRADVVQQGTLASMEGDGEVLFDCFVNLGVSG
jgi:hypothetical protein